MMSSLRVPQKAKLSNSRGMVALDLETTSWARFGGDSVAALTQLSLNARPSSSVPWAMAICLHQHHLCMGVGLLSY